MPKFTQDNTAGFSDTELAEMSDEFDDEIAEAISLMPPGQHDYLIEDMAKSIAEQVLKRHGGA